MNRFSERYLDWSTTALIFLVVSILMKNSRIELDGSLAWWNLQR